MGVVAGGVAGFSGSRRGVSSFQRAALMELLVSLAPKMGRHGDCVGSDAEFHGLCVALGVPVVVHPPSDDRLRAWCGPRGVVEVRRPRPFLVRDADIVKGSGYLLATPDGPERRVGSGTWATIRFACERGMPVFVLYPDGRVDTRGGGG